MLLLAGAWTSRRISRLPVAVWTLDAYAATSHARVLMRITFFSLCRALKATAAPALLLAQAAGGSNACRGGGRGAPFSVSPIPASCSSARRLALFVVTCFRTG